MKGRWKPRHVVAIVGMICLAAVLAPVAVHAVSTQPVSIYDSGGSNAASVDGNGRLKVDTGFQGGSPTEMNFRHEILTPKAPVAILNDQPDPSPLIVISVGATAVAATKAPSLVQFRMIRYPEEGSCDPSAPMDGFHSGEIMSLWAPPQGQADFTFSPAIASDGAAGSADHCLVAYLLSGGPVEAWATANQLQGNP
jgi:hypothetical protein